MNIALRNKIQSCTKVKLHHLDSNLDIPAIQQFLQQLQQHHLDSKTNHIHLNSHDKTATIELNSHDIAMKVYQEHNFKQYLQTKILNISLDISLSKNQSTQLNLYGITQERLRNVFDIANQFGICRLFTKYQNKQDGTPSDLLKHWAKLSIARTQPLSQDQLSVLKTKLAQIGINIKIREDREEEQGQTTLKIQVNNYFTPTHNSQNSEQIKQTAKQSLQELIHSLNQHKITTDIKIIYCVIHNNSSDSNKQAEYTAILKCPTTETTLQLFQSLRQHFLTKKDNSKARLNLNSIAPTYQVLYETNLVNYAHFSQKQYEDFLLNKLKITFKNVIQVTCQQSHKNNNIQNAKIFFTSEEAGKEFLQIYPEYEAFLSPLYIPGVKPKFNLWIDSKTLSDYHFRTHLQDNNSHHHKQQQPTVKYNFYRYNQPPVGSWMPPLMTNPMQTNSLHQVLSNIQQMSSQPYPQLKQK